MQCGRSCTGAAVAFSCGVEETLCGSFALRGNTGVGDLGAMFKRRALLNAVLHKFWVVLLDSNRADISWIFDRKRTRHSNLDRSLTNFWPEKTKNLS